MERRSLISCSHLYDASEIKYPIIFLSFYYILAKKEGKLLINNS